jgi:hypothetical protein
MTNVGCIETGSAALGESICGSGGFAAIRFTTVPMKTGHSDEGEMWPPPAIIPFAGRGWHSWMHGGACVSRLLVVAS